MKKFSIWITEVFSPWWEKWGNAVASIVLAISLLINLFPTPTVGWVILLLVIALYFDENGIGKQL